MNCGFQNYFLFKREAYGNTALVIKTITCFRVEAYGNTALLIKTISCFRIEERTERRQLWLLKLFLGLGSKRTERKQLWLFNLFLGLGSKKEQKESSSGY